MNVIKEKFRKAQKSPFDQIHNQSTVMFYPDQRTQSIKVPNHEIIDEGNDQELSLRDLVNFIREFYKQIFYFALAGLIFGYISVFLIPYTATINLSNNAGISLSELRYYLTQIPRVDIDDQKNKSNKGGKLYADEIFWREHVKPITLLNKSDGKDLLDASSLNVDGSKISSIQIFTKGSPTVDAAQQLGQIKDDFISGIKFVLARDLIRELDLEALTINNEMKSKYLTSEIELEYLQKRIKNLHKLKNQFPSSINIGTQVVDAKDSGSKYLPITTQIIAATTDANNLVENLAKYEDAASMSVVKALFVKKAEPLLPSDNHNPLLLQDLLSICEQIASNLSDPNQMLEIERIKQRLAAIQITKINRLTESGAVSFERKSPLTFSLFGLLAGLLIGLLVAFGVNIYRKMNLSAENSY